MDWDKYGFLASQWTLGEWSSWSPDLFVIDIKVSQYITMIKVTGSRLPGFLLSSGLYQLYGIGELLTLLYLSFLMCVVEVKIVPTSCYYCKTYCACAFYMISGKNNELISEAYSSIDMPADCKDRARWGCTKAWVIFFNLLRTLFPKQLFKMGLSVVFLRFSGVYLIYCSS